MSLIGSIAPLTVVPRVATIAKIFLLLIANQFLFFVPKVNSAENIKIIYSVFSRTIKVDSLKDP